MGIGGFSFLLLLAAPSVAFEAIVTEQEATTLRPFGLLVQVITEPESLIRLFGGLDLSFEMARHWARSGTALLGLPFRRDLLDDDPWRRPHYARVPTALPSEAPRYLKTSAW